MQYVGTFPTTQIQCEPGDHHHRQRNGEVVVRQPPWHDLGSVGNQDVLSHRQHGVEPDKQQLKERVELPEAKSQPKAAYADIFQSHRSGNTKHSSDRKMISYVLLSLKSSYSDLYLSLPHHRKRLSVNIF